MNERIRELIAQSTIAVDPDDREWVFSKFDKEKFAQLIVRECIRMVEVEAGQYAEPAWAFEIVNDMREHFGVQE